MGALTGGMTVKRLVTDGPPVDDFREVYVAALNAHAIRPIDPESEEDRTAGWADIAHPLNTRFEQDRVFFNEYLCVAYRVDTLKVPSGTLKLYQQEAELQWLAANHRETMLKGEKKELYEKVAKDLRAKMLPSIKAVDLVWNTATGQVWIWTHNKRVIEEIEELFTKTFDRELLPSDPYSLGERLLPEDLKDALLQVEPSSFVPDDVVQGLDRGGDE